MFPKNRNFAYFLIYSQKIVNDPLLTDEMICKNLQILFCDLSEREMKALRARRAYGYVIESGRRPPTFEDMFVHTFLINGSATKMEKFKFSLFLDEDVDYSKLKEFEGTFTKWAGSREGDATQVRRGGAANFNFQKCWQFLFPSKIGDSYTPNTENYIFPLIKKSLP